MREFITAAEKAGETQDEVDQGITFMVDKVECVAYQPGDGQLAVLMATTGRHSSQNEQIAGIINFFASVLSDESHGYIVSRLLDRRDRFGLEQVQDIIEWLIEEWSGRPTKSPSGSTASPPSTGLSSTAETPALT